MLNTVLELKKTSLGFVGKDRFVAFDEPVELPDGIEYDKTEGIITFNIIGQYSIKWWVATETTLKGSMYIDTNEFTTVWLRQKDLTEDTYSTCIIRYFPGGPNASRVEVWVEWISEDVTYGDPL